jgi:hypothetical protein
VTVIDITTTDVVDRSSATDRASRKWGFIRVLVGIQLYTVAAYLAAAVIPYLWAPRPNPPTWILIVPGWLLGVPGFYITLLGPMLAVPLAAVGALVLVLRRNSLPVKLRGWCIAAAALTTAFALFSLTPLADTIAVFVAD